MKNINKFPVLLILLMTGYYFTGAQPNPSANGTNGQIRQLENFTGISMNIPAELSISQTGAYLVRLEGHQELIDQVTTVVKDGKLVIKSKDNKWKGGNDHSLRIYIELPKLNNIELNGSGNVNTVTEIVSDKLQLELNGSGEITMQNIAIGELSATINGSGNFTTTGGSVKESVYEVNGSGKIDGGELSVVKAVATTTGSGSIAAGSVSSIDATITGSGNITFKGKDATVKKRVTGSGKLIAL